MAGREPAWRRLETCWAGDADWHLIRLTIHTKLKTVLYLQYGGLTMRGLMQAAVLAFGVSAAMAQAAAPEPVQIMVLEIGRAHV